MAKTAKEVVSKLFFNQTQKDGVRHVLKASRFGAISQTANIGTIYGLLSTGLLLLPFQSHRATAAPSSDDTIEN